MSKAIESYFHTGPGYNPFLISEGWQVAQLNYMPELAAGALRRVERHNGTAEVFILFEGRSVLIAGTEEERGLGMEIQAMRPGVTYNIPAGTWHAIAMSPADAVIIVEKSHTHVHDVEYRDLSPRELDELQTLLKGTE